MISNHDQQRRKNSILVRFAKQWVAGEEMEDAIERALHSNARGIGAIINYLGEHVKETDIVEQVALEYIRILRTLKGKGIVGSISIKPTQCGLSVDKELYRQNLLEILKEAKRMDVFVWIDMEGSPYTQITLEVYEDSLQSCRDIGLAMQANLKRSEKDVERLISVGGKVRLCKGAYREPREIAYASREDVDSSFSRLMTTLFERGERFAVATHDGRLIEEAIRLSKNHRKDFEFQMLLGIRDSLKDELVASGYRVQEYIPYGSNWIPYFMRRLRGRPRNLVTLLRSLVSS